MTSPIKYKNSGISKERVTSSVTSTYASPAFIQKRYQASQLVCKTRGVPFAMTGVVAANAYANDLKLAERREP